MLDDFEILPIVREALIRSELEVLSESLPGLEKLEALQGHHKFERDPTIFAITREDALRAAADPSGRSIPSRFKIFVKRKYLEERRSGSRRTPKFLPIFVENLAHIISRDLKIPKDGRSQRLADTIKILQTDQGNTPFSVEIKSASQTLCLDFMIWENGDNILKLLKKESPILEQVIYNPYNCSLKLRRVNKLEKLELEDFIGKYQFNIGKYQFNIGGPFLSSQSLEELILLLDLSNMVNLSTVNFRVERTDEFLETLQQKKNQSSPGQFRSAFQFLVQSNNWHKNLVEAINFKLVPLDQSATCRIPFKPQVTKKLLEKFKKHEEGIRFQSSFEDDSFYHSRFQDQQSIRLLMLIVALIGDLLVFRESKAYFKSLFMTFFGTELKTQDSILDVFKDPVLQRLLQLLPISTAFSSTNLGKQFSHDEEQEFKPLNEDSFIQMDRDTLEDSFDSELELLSIGTNRI
jgi:hypothetical protein